VNDLTPVERHGDIWLKRDDLFEVSGVRGGKVRTCYALAQGAKGLATSSHRASPMAAYVANIARGLGIPCRVHIPQGPTTPEMEAAKAAGAEMVPWRAGYTSVLSARAREDALARGWTEIPFGMQSTTAVEQTAGQVANLPEEATRLVVSVGSGLSISGILHGLDRVGRSTLPVLGVVVRASPLKRLAQFAPKGWEQRATLVQSVHPYERHVDAMIDDVVLDPVYEGKCKEYLLPGDVFWMIGLSRSVLDRLEA